MEASVFRQVNAARSGHDVTAATESVNILSNYRLEWMLIDSVVFRKSNPARIYTIVLS